MIRVFQRRYREMRLRDVLGGLRVFHGVSEGFHEILRALYEVYEAFRRSHVGFRWSQRSSSWYYGFSRCFILSVLWEFLRILKSSENPLKLP